MPANEFKDNATVVKMRGGDARRYGCLEHIQLASVGDPIVEHNQASRSPDSEGRPARRPDYGMLKQFAKTNQLGDFRANKLQMAGGNVPRFGAGVRANPSKFQKYPDLPE
jgi:hypothetical protein